MAKLPRLTSGLAAALVFVACAAGPVQTPTLAPAPSPKAPLTFQGDRAFAHAAAQMAFGPRPTGSPALRALGDSILAELAKQGWQTRTQEFIYRGTPVRNLIGIKGQAGDVVLLGAHYDTRRRADQDPQFPDQPVPGANDGASGVAVLLELARALDTQLAGKRVMLVFFDAEDNGQLDGWDWIAGSRQFASELEKYAPATPAAVVIVDMIGDAQQELYFDRNSDLGLSQEIWAVAGRLGYGDQFTPAAKWSMLDDHTPFVERGIRSVDIIDFDYPHWHRVSDTLDKLSPASLERVGRTLEVWLEGR
ncbi:MAG TPA: M28 family peptidase [Thermoflexales bacterium]|nr:M28 family peptidase [Thermoflexales bacterium]HRA52091.1 M28 family peptidase [Thermoflexales bacterium]